ncbi:urease accessory protein UreE [Jejubacter calystegiae]|uniref:Urease accessory protein UreE n=1 Tax=Jejubacter calystegiae TaxID=2579935 RepID=A0A4P8YPV9_9ENTR|nr:urease accessory protein UreE [Jejubacter calystegiae]QCT22313.1 urease accessory protein UreE [Jejubacter calystegiae]
MIIVETILGNVKRDPLWQQRLAQIDADVLALSQWEAQKSRCRKLTRDGIELGIALTRNQLLSDGDVLLWDEARQLAVVVHIQLRDVMVIQLQTEPGSALRIAFELGHALGNQHWKAVIRDNRIFVPLIVARHVMETVLKAHDFRHIAWSFVPGETVLPALTPSEARLLFGGAEDASTHVHVDTLRS